MLSVLLLYLHVTLMVLGYFELHYSDRGGGGGGGGGVGVIFFFFFFFLNKV